MSSAALLAEDRVILLLRTYYEAREHWDSRSNGSGPRLMPKTWHEGSYDELERQLALLRDGADRALWFHCTRRYRDGEHVHIIVAVQRSIRGPRYVLPESCELVAGAANVSERLASVKVYRWVKDVDQFLADLGVATLVNRMFRGRRDRIVVPDFFLRRALGLPPRDEIAA